MAIPPNKKTKNFKMGEDLHTEVKMASSARRESITDFVVRAIRRELKRVGK